MNEDVLFTIFLHCHLKSLLCLRLTNHQFYHIINNHFWQSKFTFDNLPIISKEKVNNWMREYCKVTKVVNLSTQTLLSCPHSYYDEVLICNIKNSNHLPLRFQKFITKYTVNFHITNIKISWYYHHPFYNIFCSIYNRDRFYKVLRLKENQIVDFLHHLFYYNQERLDVLM